MRVGAARFRSLPCGGRGRTVLAAIGKVEPLDCCGFLVVVPSFNHNEGKRMSLVKVTSVEVKGVFESLAAAALHVPIKSPGCELAIEPRPSRTDNDLVGMLV